MASRVSESSSSYWDPPQVYSATPYSQQQHYYSASPATSMMATQQQQQQQQQPRQVPPPLNHPMHGNANSENQSVYAGANNNANPPSSSNAAASNPSNGYYGSLYQSSQVNGSNGNGGGNYSHFIGNNNSQVPPQSNGYHGTSSFSTPSHGMLPLSAQQMVPSPYPPVGSNHSTYHLSNSGVYLRSHQNDINNGLHPLDQLPSHTFSNGNIGSHHHGHQNNHHIHHHHHQLPSSSPQQQQQQQQQSQILSSQAQSAHNGSSQHSGSPTLDGSDYGQGGMKPKRRQVKNACINCQKACKKCDEGRPCTRCIKYGLSDTCQDSARKERKRGIKRGPYKRRATTGSQPNSASSIATSHYSQSSPFMLDSGASSNSFASQQSTSTPHLRAYRAGEDANGNGIAGGMMVDQGMLNSPIYPSSAPGSVQRNNASLYTPDAPYNRNGGGVGLNDNFQQSMQPPRYTRYDFDRGTNSPGLANFNMMGHRANALPPPISAPATSMNFSSASINHGYNARSLFSPSPLSSSANNSSNFLSANGPPPHHRLNSDSSLNTLTTNSTQNSSLSPRTPMSLSANSSGSLVGGLDLIGSQPLSANSAMSSPGGINSKFGNGNNNNYVHHPGPTTTLNLPSSATGAFLNPPTTPLNHAFPLHIPQSARWRSGNGNGSNQSTVEYENKEELAPIKFNNSSSNDSEMSGGTISNRYQLPSPRLAEIPRGMEIRQSMPKMETSASNPMPTGA